MGIFKKVKPEELITKLSIAQKKLEKREATMKEKRQKAREEAKNALKNGDERGFRVTSKQYAGLQGQINTIGSMIEMSSVMLNALENQQSLTEIVEIGKDLAYAQKTLGFDTQKIEKAITDIRMAVEKVTATSEQLSTQLETLTSPEATREQEKLREELLAELKAEGLEVEKLGEKIKAEKEKL
ncbi:MAG: hypothetical protein AB1779_11060 [Candidatus Thermoplasmatota archaeon]